MKLTDLTTAAKAKAPNFELEIDKDGETIDVVFRNFLLIPEKDRTKMATAVDAIYTSKVKRSVYRKEADASKESLKAAVTDQDHIKLLEEIFSADPETRDLNWIALGEEYIKETQLGEAEPSQKR